jgi:hypothetical protein
MTLIGQTFTCEPMTLFHVVLVQLVFVFVGRSSPWIIFVFMTPYTKPDGKVVDSVPKIWAHYLRGWFAIDIVSIVPYDMLVGAVQGECSCLPVACKRLVTKRLVTNP